ncbi:Calcineurin-like protein phosphoesterase [Dinothrombium tinctorium]|uniref:Calcineurin-like protein phosphoesterase n=1 Tax=Dinothrombium tinctorium TaxID=1965070 RepID=A0A443QW28_9ACAR|nr:Calcineurin-like protein phosphoesterase [Dinothrombium tinctorium]RWS07217.1 Calcineurin-like protein phosphoesterase [Dinothrombium tinctorium]
MGVKKEKSLTKSIGFPSARRSPSLESHQQSGTGGHIIATHETSALTPEGGTPPEAFGQNLYDCCSFVIVCPKHKNIAISCSERARGLWLPFIALKQSDTWKNASIGGVSYILGHGDLAAFSQLPAVPFTQPELIQILRIQLPHLQRFITRITFACRVTHNTTEWICCQNDNRIHWINADDVMNGNVERLWGPEPYLLGEKAFAGVNTAREIVEVSLEDAMCFLPRNPPRTKEEEMLKSAVFLEKDILKLYSDFLQHCFPSQYMSYASFIDFMARIGWHPTDIRLHPIFRAFNYKATGYLSFHELLLGLGAMDQATQHGGHPGELRCGYIFRYYDVNNDGILDYADIVRMTSDIFRGKDMEADDATVEKETKHRLQAIGLKPNDGMQFGAFLHAVGAFTFRGTSVLFRSPIATLQQLAAKRTYDSIPTIVGSPALARRRTRGSCVMCRPKQYKLAVHSVRLDFNGRVTDPRPLIETEGKDVNFVVEDTFTESLRTFSRETVFNPNSGANNVLDILRQFDPIWSKRNPERRTWQSTDRNVLLNTITALCRQAEEIFTHETRCVKVNSPCFVLGDIHGNIADLMTYERNLWRMGPDMLAANYLFLGDYVDRGEYGVECVSYLFALKILAPDKYFLCRGNHEIRSIQKVFTFQKECITKYGTRIGPQIWEVINKVFDRMPICALVDETIYGAHGGIPTTVTKIDDLMKIPTPLQEPEGESPAAWEVMWNDPMNPSDFNELAEFMKVKTENIHGFLTNTKRGTAFYFTEEAVNNFLDTNGLTHILRGHEVMPLGYKFHMGGKVCTVFSSSNYCGGSNEAASIYLDGERMRVIRLETSGSNYF